MDVLSGYKSYLGALGAFCLGVYYLTQGQFDMAAGCFTAALSVFGLRQSDSKIVACLEKR